MVSHATGKIIWHAVNFLKDNAEILNAFSTLVIAVFTITIWRATDGMFKTSITSANATRDAAITSKIALEQRERAFVHITTIQAVPVFDRNDVVIEWLFFPALKNSGNTATKFGISHVSWGVFEGEIPDDFDFSDEWPEGTPRRYDPIFLPAQSALWAEEVRISVEEMFNVTDAGHNIYIWGWVEYADIFAGTPRHRVEYCNQILFAGDFTKEKPCLGFRAHRRFNACDDECSKKPLPYELRAHYSSPPVKMAEGEVAT